MTSKFLKPRALGLYALALIAGAAAAWPALATVTVTPMIAVIEGRERYADINLVNPGETTESYAMSWKHMKMLPGDGKYEELEASATPFDLTQHIVMTPRRVTIEPGGMQKIRLGMRLKGEPPAPGDYRAHLEMMQDNKPAETKSDKAYEKGQVSMGVQILVGVSIPVIYRVGVSDASATMGNISTQINPATKQIEALVPVTRSGGPFGLYGHMIVRYGGKVVGEMKNANIFPEIDQRTFVIPLNVETLSGGSLDIVYKHYDPRNETVFAQKTSSVGR